MNKNTLNNWRVAALTYVKYNRGKVLKWTVITIFVVLFSWGVSRQTADAAEVRLGLGRGASNGNEWIMQELMLTTDSHWYFGIARLGGDDVLPDTVRLTTGYRVSWRDDMRVAPYLRGGVAYFKDEPTDIISDNWAYDMALGVRILTVVDLEYQHNSTAGRSLQNSGNDIPMLAVVVPFGGSSVNSITYEPSKYTTSHAQADYSGYPCPISRLVGEVSRQPAGGCGNYTRGSVVRLRPG